MKTAAETETAEIETIKVITLTPPIKFGDKTVEELTLREPTAGEIDKAQRVTFSSAASNIELIALVSGVSARVVEKIGVRQFNEAIDFLQSFTKDAQET